MRKKKVKAGTAVRKITGKPPPGWKLTEEDKVFLRSCGVRPD